MSKLLLAIYSFFEYRKTLLFGVFGSVLLLLSILASKIEISENIFEMLPQEKESEQLTAFMKNSKFSDRMLVIISQKDTIAEADPDQLISLADSFAGKISNDLIQYISLLNYKTDDSSISSVLNVFDEHLPIFLDDNDYLRLDSAITESGIKDKVKYNYQTLLSPSGIGLKKYILKDPLGINFLAYKKLDAFKTDESIELYDNHYLTSNRRASLMFIDPAYPSSETEKNTTFFNKMDSLVHQFNIENPTFNTLYFGAPLVAAGNSKQIRKDTLLTLSITLALLLLVIVLYFRNFITPLFILIPVVFGALFAVSIIAVVKGSISIISIGAGSLVLGIAVNYSLHFLTHLKYHPNIRDAIKELSFPMTIGSLTTIGGFLSLQFVNAPVLRDLGLYAGLSLLGAALATLIFLPHFVNPAKINSSVTNSQKEPILLVWLKSIPTSKYFVWLLILITPVLLYFAPKVEFESDMYKVNYMSNELTAAEKEVNKISSYYQKSIYLFNSGTTLEEALVESEKSLPLLQGLKRDGIISTFTSVSQLLPSVDEQNKRIAKWEKYWSKEKINTVYDRFTSEGKTFQFKETAFLPLKYITEKRYLTLTPEETNTLKESLLNNFIDEKDGKVALTSLIKTTPENTQTVYKTFSNSDNTVLFDRKYITDKLVGIVNADFNFITIWTSLLVFIALLLTYGRIELALISFLPMVVSWIWILGIMALLDIKFNIINIILSTLIFALGDDFCIFTTDGLQQRYARKANNIRSVSTSITLSVITTIIGMGVLVFAQHPALQSIGFVSIVGILCVWLISQALQPLLFNFFITKPTASKHEPYSFFNIVKSIFAFSYFTFGAILIGMIGIILLKLIPGNLTKRKYIYHYILSKFCGSMIYIMVNVKKKIINNHKENFLKPAVIIANHSSFLDILLLVMLHPKLILLTNKWVWNSPVFGLAIRLAEYYPVIEGANNTIPQLSKKVAEGYSIVVFPEGTRSGTGKLGRFHKGAFYLAEHMKLDILPIVIHGANYTMTKNHFYLKNGSLTINFLPRIKVDDTTFGATYQERTKLVGKYFKEEYTKLSEKVETPSYFKQQLFSNFLFKGPVLEWYMKIKVGLEKNYELFNNLIPKSGKIADVGCGYGFLSYMLGYTSKDRQITGIDYDVEKIEIAQNGYLKSDHVNFVHEDAMSYQFSNEDAIILSDILHYLGPKHQLQLLEKCVQNTNPGGIIVIRDGVKELETRHKGTRISELFSTKILGFNKTGHQGLSFISSTFIESFAGKHHLQLSVIDTSRLTSNLIFVLKKPA